MKNKRRATKLDARGVSPEERVRLGSLMGETDATDLGEYSLLFGVHMGLLTTVCHLHRKRVFRL